MSFSTQDCKNLLIKVFNKTDAKDWTRINKSKIQGVVTRRFSHPFAGEVLLQESNNALIFSPAKYIPTPRVFSDKELEIGRKILHSYLTGSEYNHSGKLIVEYQEGENDNRCDSSLILDNPFFKKNLYCITPFFQFTFPEDTYANDNPKSLDEECSTRRNDFFCFYLVNHLNKTEMNGAELVTEFFPIHLSMMDEAHFNPDNDFPFDKATLRLMFNTLVSSGFIHKPNKCILTHLLANIEDNE